MSKLFFANAGYAKHTTDEGEQLQRGLEAAGWTLAGRGFADGLNDTARLLERHRPEMVIVHDKRDWDSNMRSSFNLDNAFEHIAELCKRPDIFKLAVVKDAGTVVDYHRHFCREIGADAVLTYYHERSVTAQAEFLKEYRLVRTYHSIDGALAACVDLRAGRRRALVSGATGGVYPLRATATQHAKALGCDVLPHPGYGIEGNKTPAYLRTLAGYRVHIATASRYGFALRKIIESVAMGCTPVTDLPSYDALPCIDAALVRVRPDASVAELAAAVDEADSGWDADERAEYAGRAREFYDFRAAGFRLTAEIAQAARERVLQ